MLPILLSLGPIKIFSYGLCAAIGIFFSLFFWWKMGRDEHWDEIALFDGYFLALITFFIFGRIGYVLLHMSEMGTIYRSLAILTFPGIDISIGIVAATIFVWLFSRAQNWHVWKVADAYVVALSIVLVFGGLGGFLNGSNPGIESSWGLKYVGESVARVPVDLWIFLWSIVTFAVVSRVRKEFRFYEWYKGDSSTVREGLASLIFILLLGINYLVLGLIDQVNLKLGLIRIEFLVGIMLIVVSAALIGKRVGRRDDGLWGKLSNIIRRK